MKLIFFFRNIYERNLIYLDKIPAILYNKKTKNINIKINNNKYYYEKLKLKVVLNAKFLNNYYNVIIKDINYHYYKRLIFHIDFLLI